MKDAPPDAASAEQRSWVRLAEEARDALAKRVVGLREADADAADTLVVALRQAMWWHQDALAFDKDLELKLSRSAWSD